MGERLMKYYNYVAEQEGLDGKIALAKATNLPSQKASTAPDSRDNIETFRTAIADITGESPPRFGAPGRETGATAGGETRAGTPGDDDVPDDVERTITRAANRLDERYADRASDRLSERSRSLEAAFQTAAAERLAEFDTRLDAAFKTAKHEDETTPLARADVRRYVVAAGLALCALGVLGYVVL